MDGDKINTIFLSYSLTPETPAYGNGDSLGIEPLNRMDAGDSCNTLQLKLPNHLGTHIDSPRHFSYTGKTITDYPAGFWIFTHPHILDISPVSPGHLIGTGDLSLSDVENNIDILMVKTGFGKLREKALYWENNPGFAANLFVDLRNRFPSLKILGFDTISLSSFSNRNEGRKAHRAFLDSQQPILLLEDMDLRMIDANTKIVRVIISPLMVENADGAPCTVFAEIDD